MTVLVESSTLVSASGCDCQAVDAQGCGSYNTCDN